MILDIDPSLFFVKVFQKLCHNTEPSDHNLTKKKIMKKKNYEKNTTTTKFDEDILEKIDDDDDFLVALNESD